jgi:predicted acetyltransferase
MSEIKLIHAKEEHFSVLSNLSKYYTYDVSEFASELYGYEIGPDGNYAECVKEYWEDPTINSILLQVDDEWAGFALVKTHTNTDKTHHEIAEFFVVRKFRRNGIATLFAHRVFDTYPGNWEVNVWPGNPVAVAFWGKAISKHQKKDTAAVQNFHVEYDCDMVTHVFVSSEI